LVEDGLNAQRLVRDIGQALVPNQQSTLSARVKQQQSFLEARIEAAQERESREVLAIAVDDQDVESEALHRINGRAQSLIVFLQRNAGPIIGNADSWRGHDLDRPWQAFKRWHQ
jgi:hypothetical protein